MKTQNDTLENNNTSSTPPQGSGTGTAPGQQSGQPGQSSGQTSPPNTGTAPGQQSGSSPEGNNDDTRIELSLEDLNARNRQAGRSALRDRLQSLGFDNLDDDKSIDNALAQLKQDREYAETQRRAAMTAEQQVQADLETAQQTAQTERQAREQAESERAMSQTQLREFILRFEIIGAAGGAIHPGDVYDFVRKYAMEELSQVIKEGATLFDDENVFQRSSIDSKKVEAIIEKCKKERPEWWQTQIHRTPGSPSNASNALPPGTGDVEKMTRMKELARQNLRRSS
jgi:hypothetical protein